MYLRDYDKLHLLIHEFLNIYENVQMKNLMRGLCANAAEGYRAFSTPWGAPTLAEAAGAEDFPLEAK